MLISLIYFFAIVLGTGSITYILGWTKEEPCEKLFISIGTGICLIPVFGIIFNAAGIPLTFQVFLAAAAVCAASTAWVSFRRHGPRIFRLGPPDLRKFLTPASISVTIIFTLALIMYLKGSFAYSWFEDDDPWLFATSSKYIALYKTFTTNAVFASGTSQPYPQGYQIIMGIMNQICPSLNWTMKFYNALFVSLSLPFFYFMMARMVKRREAAMLSTALLFSIPAWLTHFIFPFNLTMTLFPLLFYYVARAGLNGRWYVMVGATIASIWSIHMYTAVMISIMYFLYYMTAVYSEGKPYRGLIGAYFSGAIFSALVFWAPSLFRFRKAIFVRNEPIMGLELIVPAVKLLIGNTSMIAALLILIACGIFLYLHMDHWFYRLKDVLRNMGAAKLKPYIPILCFVIVLAVLLIPKKIIFIPGSSRVNYNINHFFLFFNKHNLKQNPIGIGIVAMFLAAGAVPYYLIGIRKLFTARRIYAAAALVWFAFAFAAVNGLRLSICVMPFRMWTFLAIPVAMLGGFFYEDFLAVRLKDDRARTGVIGLLIAGMLFTWWTQKWILNVKVWKDGYILVPESHAFYGRIKDHVPKNSTAYALSSNQCIPIVYDMISFEWDKEVREYAGIDMEATPDENHEFLKRKGYEYVILDISGPYYIGSRTLDNMPKAYISNYIRTFSKLMILKIRVMRNSDKFRLIQQEKSGAIFRIL
ncbi:MAG: hypothetical protein ABH885_01750 [Candidatus Omnitrophota bacterium]